MPCALRLHQQFVLSGCEVLTYSRRAVLVIRYTPTRLGKAVNTSLVLISLQCRLWWCSCSDRLLVFKLGCLLSFRSSSTYSWYVKIQAWCRCILIWKYFLSCCDSPFFLVSFKWWEVLNFSKVQLLKQFIFGCSGAVVGASQGLSYVLEWAPPSGASPETQAPGARCLLAAALGLWNLVSVVVVARGLVAPRHLGSSHTRDQTLVPCVSRQTPKPRTTREVSLSFSSMDHAFGIISKNSSPNPTSQSFSGVFCLYRS